MANIADDNNEVLNVELDKIFQWLCANKLSVNIKKTKYILFHNLHKNIENIKLDLKLNNTSIERVNKFNFLGVTLDEHLNWKCHIENIALKISRSNGIFYKLKHSLPGYIMKTLYNSLILPHLTYGILLWGHNCERIRLLSIIFIIFNF